MTKRTRGTLAAAAVLLLGLAGAPAQASPTEGPTTVRVSGDSPLPEGCAGTRGQESEPVVAVDPRDPRQQVAAWVQDDGAGLVTSVSEDGGRTWSAGSPVPGLTSCTGGALPFVAHPHVEFGPERGVVHLAAMASDRGLAVQTLVSRSTDGGSTWSLTSRPDAVGGDLGNDFDSFAVDPTTGDLLVVWNPVEPNVVREPTNLSRSTDGGRTWTVTQVRTAAPGTSGWNDLLVLPDGTLWLVHVDSPLSDVVLPSGAPVPVQALASRDGGRTWSAPQVLGTGAAVQWPRGAVGEDGSVHVAWLRSRSDGTCTRFPTGPGRSGGGACELAVASSVDGATWSPARSLGPWDGDWMPSPGLAAGRGGSVTVVHSQPDPSSGSGQVLLSTGTPGADWETARVGDVDLAALGSGGLYQGAAAGRCSAVGATLLRDTRAPGPDTTAVFVVQPHGRGCGR